MIYCFVIACLSIITSCTGLSSSNLKRDLLFFGSDKDAFTIIYNRKIWPSYNNETVSGPASSLEHTEILRKELMNFFQDYAIHTVVDAACGDFNWMKEMDLSFLDWYLGIDIVEPLIEKNKELYEKNNISFSCLDVQYDDIPKADVIICRSLLPHFPLEDCKRILRQFKKSGSTYLLITHYHSDRPNTELAKEYRLLLACRPLNLEKPPFNFPKPIMMIDEQCPSAFLFDKTMALWRLEDIII